MAGSGCCDGAGAGAERRESGLVVLVVGPSGAGKDAILAAVRSRFAGDSRFLFPTRIVTRPPSGAEENKTVSEDEFEALVREGALALHWSAHGLRYGLSTALDDAVNRGGVVVFNASRRVIALARERYTCAVVYIDAPLHVRAQRLSARNRERAEDIAARLERTGGFEPRLADLVIDNNGSLCEAAERLGDWLIAARSRS